MMTLPKCSTYLLSAVLLISSMLSACQPGIPDEALTLSRENMARRQLQTRVFDTHDERLLLQASAGVLQDLGFNLDESETELGVVVGSKDRSAVEAGQVAGQIAMAVLLGAYTPIDKEQKIRASLVSRPLSGLRTAVRVTFQRIVWNDIGEVSKAEFINDPGIYRQFFEQLSQSVFLTANEI